MLTLNVHSKVFPLILVGIALHIPENLFTWFNELYQRQMGFGDHAFPRNVLR